MRSVTFDELEKELLVQQSEYVKKERVYRLRVKELSDELGRLKSERRKWMASDPKMASLKGMHGEILKNIGALQTQTVDLVSEQERDLSNAFRQRLLEVQKELEKEREKKDDGAAAWIDRSRKLEAEVKKEREAADRLDRVNETLGTENSRLKQQFENQREDRAFLMKQLGAVRDENNRMQNVLAEKQQQKTTRSTATKNNVALVLPEESPAPLPALSPMVIEAPAPSLGRPLEASYREMIRKLTRTLELERKHVLQVKQAHDDWAKQRTPLEHALRRAAEEIAQDVQKRINKTARHKQHDHTTTAGPLDPDVLSNFTHRDREKTIELWLSFDGVLDALYDEEDQQQQQKGNNKTTSQQKTSSPATAAAEQ